jgi:hypothetical protein
MSAIDPGRGSRYPYQAGAANRTRPPGQVFDGDWDALKPSFVTSADRFTVVRALTPV